MNIDDILKNMGKDAVSDELEEKVQTYIDKVEYFTIPELQAALSLSYGEAVRAVKQLEDIGLAEYVSGIRYRAVKREEEEVEEEDDFETRLRKRREELMSLFGVHPDNDEDDDDEDDDVEDWFDDDEDSDDDEDEDDDDDDEDEDDDDFGDWDIDGEDEEELEDEDEYDGIYEGDERYDLPRDLRDEPDVKFTPADMFPGDETEIILQQLADADLARPRAPIYPDLKDGLPAKSGGYRVLGIENYTDMGVDMRFAISEDLEIDIANRLEDTFTHYPAMNGNKREDAVIKFDSDLNLPDGSAFCPSALRAESGKLLLRYVLDLSDEVITELSCRRDFYFALRRHSAGMHNGAIYVSLTKKRDLYKKMMDLYAAVCETQLLLYM